MMVDDWKWWLAVFAIVGLARIVNGIDRDRNGHG